MTQLKSSSSFSPMTFRDYIQNFFTKCNNKDNTNWGWFVDIEQNNHKISNCNNLFKYNHNYPLKNKKSYSDMNSEPELLFTMDEDTNIKTSCYKKLTYNLIGILFVAVIYVILL